MTAAKTFLRVLLFTTSSAVGALAQTTGTPKPGDDAWASLTTLRATASIAGRPTNSSASQSGSGTTISLPAGGSVSPGSTSSPVTGPSGSGSSTTPSAKVTANRQLAAAAKTFYTQYPTHPQAPSAKKLEALAGIEGIGTPTSAGPADPVYEQTALAVATAYRVDQKNSPSDRFEVAHSIERYGITKRLGGKSWLSAPIESEPMADRLRVEFGHLPEVYGNYLNVAEHTNCDRSGEVATRLLRMPAPASVKAQAQVVLDRARLMQQPLDFALTTSTGKSTRLSTLAGKRTVVYFWSPTQSPSGPSGLQPFKKAADPDVQWVYVAIGALPSNYGKGAKQSVAPPGTTCVEPLALKSPLVAQLKITQFPWVLLLDEQKHLSSFGRPDELSWMLTHTNRLLEQ